MFYGDAIIIPAWAVLAASEGIRTIPGAGVGQGVALLLTIAIVIALFAVQARGQRRLLRLAGPICLAWFGVIALLGLWHVVGPVVLDRGVPDVVRFLRISGLAVPRAIDRAARTCRYKIGRAHV